MDFMLRIVLFITPDLSVPQNTLPIFSRSHTITHYKHFLCLPQHNLLYLTGTFLI